MAVLLANNATSRLASSLTAAATTLSVTSGEGARFPSPSGDQWFPLTLIKASGALEILKCTTRSGDVFTVARAQEGTAAQSFSAGDRVEVRATKAVFEDQSQKTAEAKQAADNAQSAADSAQSAADLGVKKDANTSTGAALLPSGTTAQRPSSPSPGMLRQNSETGETERYQGGKWLPFNVMDKALNEAPVVTLASAATVNIGAATANTINISGTVAITAFDTIAAGAVRRLVFEGALTLTHSTGSLILPGASNIITAAGDVAEFVSIGGGSWRCIGYQKASGTPLGSVFSKEYSSAEQTITSAGLLTISHGLGTTPKLIQGRLVCKVAEAGYSVGDEIIAPITYDVSDNGANIRGCMVIPDSANIVVKFNSASVVFGAFNKSTGGSANLTNANWRLVLRAWA